MKKIHFREKEKENIEKAANDKGFIITFDLCKYG